MSIGKAHLKDRMYNIKTLLLLGQSYNDDAILSRKDNMLMINEAK